MSDTDEESASLAVKERGGLGTGGRNKICGTLSLHRLHTLQKSLYKEA